MSEQEIIGHNFEPGDGVAVIEYWAVGFKNDPHWGKGARIHSLMGISELALEFKLSELKVVTIVGDDPLTRTTILQEPSLKQWWYNSARNCSASRRSHDDSFFLTPVDVMQDPRYDSERHMFSSHRLDLLTTELDAIAYVLEDQKKAESMIGFPPRKSLVLEKFLFDIKEEFHASYPGHLIQRYKVTTPGKVNEPTSVLTFHHLQRMSAAPPVEHELPARMRAWVKGMRENGDSPKIELA